MDNQLVKNLIVDSGAFIRNAKLEEIGLNIFTLPDVVREIRDKATRERLEVLPYQIQYREPSADDIKIVSDFSKKTGDYPSLSATDIRVLALVYLIHKEKVGVDGLRTEPINQSIAGSDTAAPAIAVPSVGFHNPKPDDIPIEDLSLADSGHESSSSEDDDDWITLGNVIEAKQKMGIIDSVKPSNTDVACLTTDFAMQNVAIQMGLCVVSIDGYLIKQTKTFILRCHACFKTTSIMSKQFCPNCGNKTLKRVSVSVNEDGTKNVQVNFRRPLNIRGTRYSLPMPKGGKHAQNPIVCEDQPCPQNRPSKSAQIQLDIHDPAYEIRSSPFAINDVYTRAGLLGIRNKSSNQRRGNPNSTGKRTGNRKK